MHLVSNGIRVWIAPRDIGVGESYLTAIIKGIIDCNIIVMIFTANPNSHFFECNGNEWLTISRL